MQLCVGLAPGGREGTGKPCSVSASHKKKSLTLLNGFHSPSLSVLICQVLPMLESLVRWESLVLSWKVKEVPHAGCGVVGVSSGACGRARWLQLGQ